MRPTWSNRTDLLWFTTSVTARCWPTLDDDFLCRGGVRDYNAFAEALATGPKYLAWFREPGRRRPYRPAALPAELQLTELGSWPDGGLYRVELRRESASLARG